MIIIKRWNNRIRSKTEHGNEAALVNKARGSKELPMKPCEAKSKLTENDLAM